MHKKVLVIGDDPGFGKRISLFLKPLAVTVLSAFSGTEVVKQAYAIHPDFAILDITRPGMDRFEVCSRLGEFSSFPILVLTNAVYKNIVLHGSNRGACDLLRKPFSKDEFETLVRVLLRCSKNKNFGKSPTMQFPSSSTPRILLIAKKWSRTGKAGFSSRPIIQRPWAAA